MLQEDWDNTSRDLASIYDTLNLSTVINRSLNFLSIKIKCKNIFWFLPEEVFAIVNSRDKYNPAPVIDRAVYLNSMSSSINLDDVVDLVKSFDIDKETLESNSQKITKKKKQVESVIYPVVVGEKKKVIGYFLFEDIPLNKKTEILDKIDDIVGKMSQHLNFSVDYFRIKSLSYVDDLTELYNQRYLPLALEREVTRSKKSQQGFSVLFIDVDSFKQVNDKNGHIVGSQALIDVAKFIKELIRETDYAFRYGGDEFVVVLPKTTQEQGNQVAERIRKKIEKNLFKYGKVKFSLTVSIGLACFPEHADKGQAIIDLADQAMYKAKANNKNTVYITAS